MKQKRTNTRRHSPRNSITLAP